MLPLSEREVTRTTVVQQHEKNHGLFQIGKGWCNRTVFCGLAAMGCRPSGYPKADQEIAKKRGGTVTTATR